MFCPPPQGNQRKVSAHGLNGIPYEILNLLKKDISKQVAYLFNLSLSSGVFPSLFKIVTHSQKGFKARLS